jgi:peptide/nickel transport system substrate-binding protein
MQFRKTSIILGLILAIMLASMPLALGCQKEAAPAPAAATSITIGLGGSEPRTLDPLAWGTSAWVGQNIFEALINYDAEGKMVPCLATEWSYSPDGKTLDFKIRQGVKFSNGDPLKAEDFVFSLDRAAKSSPPIMEQLMEGFEKAEAVDDYTLRFHLTHMSILFLYKTAAQLRAQSKTYYDRVGEEKFVSEPIGTGPYKYAGWQPGQYIDLVVNEDYWGPKPQIKKAHILIGGDDSTRLAMLQSGEVDMITEAPWQNANSLQEAGYNRFDTLQPYAVMLVFHLLNPNTPWADIRVRQAIDYAIDKDGIVNQLFHGVPKRIQWLLPRELGYDPSLRPDYPYDIGKAKDLLTQAGYADGFNMKMVYLTNMPGVKDIADYIANSLKQLNINCELVGMQMGPEFIETLRKSHDDPNAEVVYLWEPGGVNDIDPAISLMDGFYSKKPVGLWGNPDLDKIAEEAIATLDEAKRAELIKQAYKIVDRELPRIQICLQSSVTILKSNITYVPTTNANGPASALRDMTIK